MKTVLVTGATDGIGLETARQLVAHGWHVLVHARSEDKAERAAHALGDAALHGGRLDGHGRTEAVWGEFCRMAEVRRLAHQVLAKAPVLDALINNAGTYQNERHITADGLELTMAVNHFAPFVLTHHLLPALLHAASGRIVTVSSIAHARGRIDPGDLAFHAGFDGYAAYAASKLANILFTRALARRLAGSRVTANCLHPGVISTKLLWAGFKAKGRSVQEGARTSVWLATAPHVAGVSGGYFVDCVAREPAPAARDEALAEALWQASEAAVAPFLT